jgi:dolichol-phosphate mannosyltransferase
MKLSIITPTYNEAANIESLASKISTAIPDIDYELIVVDDDSPDKTWKIAQDLSKKYPIHVLRRKNKKGLSSAVLDGFKKAHGNLLCVIDADLSHPPEIIPDMIKILQRDKSDIVVASRYSGGGTKDWPLKRKIFSRFATILARPITSVKDPMSGFFIVRKHVIQNSNLVPRGYKILLEILAKCDYDKVSEYPFVFKDRAGGKSKLNLKISLEYVAQCLSLYAHKMRGFK